MPDIFIKIFDKEFNIKSFKKFEFDSKKKVIWKIFYGFNRNDNTNHLTKLLDIFQIKTFYNRKWKVIYRNIL